MTPEQFEQYYQLPKEVRMTMFQQVIAEIEDEDTRKFYQSLKVSDDE